MRIDIHTGFAKWTKAFYIKTVCNSQKFTSSEMSQDETVLVLHFCLGTPYIYRISANGTIVQAIIFGTLNLKFSPTTSYASLISVSELLITQDVQMSTYKMGKTIIKLE